MVNKLVGQNYITPDLVAKVTGRAKYAEDFRAEGMLFAKLLLSPMPHARVTRLDVSEALVLPGVRAILTADELPAPADSVNDNGTVIRANLLGERALTNEPVYEGEPILAVAAVDELTAAEAIERIQIEFEPLPFVVDPLKSLRPEGPNARTQGNIWRRPAVPAAVPGTPPPALPLLEIQPWKWTPDDLETGDESRLPMGQPTDEWSYGDLEAGFAGAALVLDQTFVTPNTSHQPLETRTAMAYWQNDQLHVHCSTQSTSQTVTAVARWMNIDATNVVVVSEYTGGGFGSKVTAAISVMIPALLAKKTNAPVMMRVSREEEHYIGRARPSQHGRARVGFAKDGRITALDMFVVVDNGPYEQQGDAASSGRIASLLYQPLAMRFRSVSVLTNTPPRGPQSSPGGMQASGLLEPVLTSAAQQLGIDHLQIHAINAPAGKASFGAPNAQGNRPYVTSAFVQETLERGAEVFGWTERKAASGQRVGSRVRGVGVGLGAYVAGSTGFDGLFVIKPDGRVYIQSGIGNLGTESMIDVHRVVGDVLGVPWERCEVTWGNTAKHLPWACISGGSQTAHAMSRAAYAAAMDAKGKLQALAAEVLGGSAESYTVSDERSSAEAAA